MVEDAGAGSEPVATDSITSLVAAAREGDRDAADRLYRAVYDELRRIARAQRVRLGSRDTMSTTVVVHELYLRLERADRLAVADRHHFFSLAARVMRQILIDGARRELAGRRGAGVHVEPLDEAHELVAPQCPADLVALDEALDALAVQDAGLAELVELHFFAGLSFDRIAETTGGSERTLRRQWRRARAFLYDRMGSHP
jgi:RNA polymerase sigma factor (TIGR02999 family)